MGRLADDSTLDLLFEMSKDDYWLARSPKACEKGKKSEGFRDHMRIMALNAIANSGRDRAINAFTTKEGIPVDKQGECSWLLGASKYNQKTRNEQEKK